MSIKQFNVLSILILFTLVFSSQLQVQAQNRNIGLLIFDDNDNNDDPSVEDPVVEEITSNDVTAPAVVTHFEATNYIYLPTTSRSYPIIASDDFNNSNSGWFTVDATTATIDYLNNEYRILNKSSDSNITVTDSDFTFTEFAAEIDIRTAGSVANGGYGIAFAFNNADPRNATKTYLFLVYPDIQTWYYVEQDLSNDTNIIPNQGTSSAINTGNNTNELTIELTSAGLNLGINGTNVLATTAPSTTSSRLGLVSATNDISSHDVRFDNLVVYSR